VAKKIRSLLFSTLYPSGVRPGHGIFVETRLRELLKSDQVETRVVAPVPWFFSTHPRYGEYARMAQIPEREEHHGIDVLHPRYFLPPKVGMSIAPFLMALGAIPAIRKLLREGFDFDLIDAHYYYPDGVAAALLAKWFRKPLLITARGTDVNLISRYFVPRQLIRWAAKQASASITVSNALSEVLENVGADRSKLMVLRNGVDLQRFCPVSQEAARQELGWSESPTLLSVGNLVENKGHGIAIEALAHLSDFRLVIVGAGPEKQALEALATRLGVAQRLLFIGRVGQESLLTYYNAADILILASSREGWPNVLLESMACGTPVVATDVGGIPEVVTTPEAGRMTKDRSVEGFLKIIRELWSNYPDRAAVRRHAEMFSWEAITAAQVSLFQCVSEGRMPSSVGYGSQTGSVISYCTKVEPGDSSKHA
jgi:glycosyltransferase involved in cell wall biosynthesis